MCGGGAGRRLRRSKDGGGRGGGRLELIFRTEYLTNISTDSHVEPANICSYSRDRVERSLCYDGMMYEYL